MSVAYTLRRKSLEDAKQALEELARKTGIAVTDMRIHKSYDDASYAEWREKLEAERKAEGQAAPIDLGWGMIE